MKKRFPIITHISQFDEVLKSKKEIRLKEEIVLGKKFFFLNYMFCDKDTFSDDLIKECRGIVFDEDGNLVSRPFHKFFNIGEREDTKFENIDWEDFRISLKVDGSMAIPHVINDKVVWRTKKTFYSDVAGYIQQYYDDLLTEDVNAYNRLTKNINLFTSMGYTPMFEFTSPNNTVVIDFEKPNLTLLCIRNNESGEYFNANVIKENHKEWGYLIEYLENPYYLLNHISNLKDIEGFVIHSNGEMYKCKTAWYLKRHKLIGTLSYKNVIGFIEDGSIDDVKASCSQYGYQLKVNKLNDIVKEFKDSFLDLEIKIESAYSILNHTGQKTRKEFATEINEKKEFKSLAFFLFKLYDNESIEKLLSNKVAEDLKEKYKNEVIQ